MDGDNVNVSKKLLEEICGALAAFSITNGGDNYIDSLIEKLEEFIESEDIWFSEIPDSILEIKSPSFNLKSAVDYTLIYNQTNSCNITLPKFCGVK